MSTQPPPSSALPDVPTAAPASDGKSDARARRIAAAVERSKTEYKSEHAYTERGWHLDTPQAGPSKSDRQHVEYASTSRLAAPSLASSSSASASTIITSAAGDEERRREARGALDDILALPKPHALPRELLTMGIRAAVLAEDPAQAVALARAARGHWKSNVGVAVQCSEGLRYAGKVRESTHPLFHSIAFALHHPVLVLLSERLHALLASPSPATTQPSSQALSTLSAAVEALAASRAWAFPPLFAGAERALPRPVEGGSELRVRLASVDLRLLGEALGLVQSTSAEEDSEEGKPREETKEDKEALKLLENALRRMGGALSRPDHEDEAEAVPGERVERGVREL